MRSDQELSGETKCSNNIISSQNVICPEGKRLVDPMDEENQNYPYSGLFPTSNCCRPDNNLPVCLGNNDPGGLRTSGPSAPLTSLQDVYCPSGATPKIHSGTITYTGESDGPNALQECCDYPQVVAVPHNPSSESASAPGSACTSASDCTSGNCSNGTCAA